jgi:hypothetical protein
MVPSVGKGLQKKLVPDSYAFFPSGEVYWGLPDGGMENFDMTRARNIDPGLCGIYRVVSNEVHIVWEGGTMAELSP